MTAKNQAAYAAREKAKGPEYSARKRAAIRAWQERNRNKRNAHGAVYRAIKAGKLVRPDECARCGTACKPEASHDDYARPLVVEWLCRLCHAAKDARPRTFTPN